MFLTTVGGVFDVYVSAADIVAREDPNDMSYWISLKPGAEAELLLEAKRTAFTDAERRFFDGSYSLAPLEDKIRAYGHSLLLEKKRRDQLGIAESGGNHHTQQLALELPDDLTRDYSTFTVQQLRERCRERGLPVSGVKASLLERVEADVRSQVKEIEEEASSLTETTRRDGNGGGGVIEALPQIPQRHGWPPMVPEDVARHLEDLVVEFLRASGGKASSRNVGRFLAANKSSDGQAPSALQELKASYGSLVNFVQERSEVFEKSDDLADLEGKFAFSVKLLSKDSAATK